MGFFNIYCFQFSFQEVLMAHGLGRVSYATCDPSCKQFCFLARQPGGHINKQYCHLFVTKTAEQVDTILICFTFTNYNFFYIKLHVTIKG